MDKVKSKEVKTKTGYKGHVDIVTTNLIRGWAMPISSNDPIKVDLWIDGKKTLSTIADKPRPKLKEKGIHTTGNCGFVFKLSDSMQLSKLCTIKVTSEGEGKVGNSPWVFNPNLGGKDAMRILVVGLAKSGTSILTYRIADGMGEHKMFFEPKASEGLVDIAIHKQITANPRMIAKALFYPQAKSNLAGIGKMYNKKIWIVRDPRDHLISTFFYRWRHKGQYDSAAFEKCLAMVKKKEANPISVSFTEILDSAQYNIEQFTKQYAKVARVLNNVNKNWFILNYEDFVDNKVEFLNTYLGFDINTKASVDPSLKRVERSKAYGNWRSWFTEADVVALKPILNDKLKNLGYDEKDWKLDKDPKLSSKVGSEYMTNLVSQ